MLQGKLCKVSLFCQGLQLPLDKEYADLCLKSTKQADKSLYYSGIDAKCCWTLSEAMEIIHAADGDPDQVELDLERLVAALEGIPRGQILLDIKPPEAKDCGNQ